MKNHSLKNQHKTFGLALSMAFFLFVASASVRAQAQQYIFMLRYGTNNYKLLDGATTGSTEYKNTSVFHTTCIWEKENEEPTGQTGINKAHVHFLNSSGSSGYYLKLYDAHRTGDVVAAKPDDADKLWFDVNRVHAPSSNDIYYNLAFPGGIGSLGWRYWHTTNLFDDKYALDESYTCVVCPIHLEEGFSRLPAINSEIGLSTFNTITSSTYMRSQSALYYKYYQGTGHTSNGKYHTDRPYTFYAQEGKAITETRPDDYNNFSYRWDLYDGSTLIGDSDSHVSINHSTGEVTYLAPWRGTNKHLTLTLTATWLGDPSKTAIAEREIVFNDLNDPSNITANDMQLKTRETKLAEYTLTGSSPIYNKVTLEKISGNDGIIRINSDNTITGLHIGTVTVRASAACVEGDPQTTTFTVRVIDLPATHETGIEDNIAYLNDLEDHSWSYYTTESPENLRSLNPADVRISYYGNGTKTVTITGENGNENAPTVFNANARNVKVGVDADVHSFVYYKTLERVTPATGEGRCEYTTIPNPFSVRPTVGATTSGTTQVTFEIGNPSALYDGLPISNYNNYSLTQQIYTKDELGDAGTITKIGFYYVEQNGEGNFERSNIRIFMKHVGYDYFPNNNREVLLEGNKVFDGSITFTPGWNEITLNGSGFEYNGTDNLLICFDDDSHSRGTKRYFRAYPTDQATTLYYYTLFTVGNPDPFYSGEGTRLLGKNYLRVVKQESVSVSENPWRGFYKWRIVSVTGGKIYTTKTGGTPLSANAIVDAEQELYFEPNDEYGMDVQFEALWAQAYVYSAELTGSTHTMGELTTKATGTNAYERNFFVLKGTSTTYANASTFQKSYPCTVSSLYPNGTTNGTTSPSSLTTFDIGSNCYVYNTFTTSQDTKFEYVRVYDHGNYFSANNNHNLTLGRGILPFGGNAYNVRYLTGHRQAGTTGSGTTAYTGVNNRIRIESGRYSEIYPMGKNTGSGGTEANPNKLLFGGYNKVTVTLGCDYDRAAGINNKLMVVYSSTAFICAARPNNSVYLSWNANSSDKDKESIAWILKSGRIKTYQLVSGAFVHVGPGKGEADRCLYVGIMGYGATDYGTRSFLMEGGEIANISGGMDLQDGTTGSRVNVRIKGGTVDGCIYGGAEYLDSKGDRKFVITGGTINGWIAGGCNGTDDEGGALYGSSHMYIGGKAEVVQKCRDGYDPYDNPDPEEPYIGNKYVYNTTDGTGAFGGNIFGAGCGFQPKTVNYSGDPTTTPYPNPNTTVGKVFGATIVVADNAVVGRDIYGGGKFGFVADNTTGDTGLGTTNHDMKSRIYILGGTIHGDVMGGSRNQINQAAEVYIRGGELVGRKQENPTNRDLEYYGDVYGGCDSWGEMKGTATIDMTGGTVTNIFGGGYGLASNMSKNVTVTISGGLVKGNVYGGGECGMTGKNGADPVTTVNIRGGEIRGNVFGGALGTANTVHVKGPKYVNIGMGATGRVDKENCYIGGNVYGGSQRADDYYTYIASGHPSTSGQTNISSWVNVASGYIEKHVFGAGFFGHTYGSTKVFIGKNAILNAPDHVTRPTGYLYDEPNTLIINGDVFGGADFGSFDGQNFGAATIEGYNDIYIDGKDYDTRSQDPKADDYMNIGGSVYGCGTSCYASNLAHGTSVYIRNYGHDVLNPGFNPTSIEQPRFLPPTRELQSIQFSDKLVIDKTHLHLVGQGKINSLITSEKYSVYEMEDVINMVNGSTLSIDYPVDQIRKLGSYSCNNLYESESYTEIEIDGLGDAGSITDNKIGINNGTSLYVHHNNYSNTNPPTAGYGMLQGFFHLMGTNNTAGNAYARPKQSKDTGNQIPTSYYENNLDGGFVSYYTNYDATTTYYNRFTAGSLTSTSTDATLAPGLGTPNVQIAYTNHTDGMSRAGEAYFRVWEYRKGIGCFRDGTLDAHSNGTYVDVNSNSIHDENDKPTYSVATVDIILPELVSGGTYRIKTNGDGSIAINYGEDVIPVNAGYTVDPGKYTSITTGDNWMYYGSGFQREKAIDEEHVAAGLTDMNTNPDVKFGLVMKPNGVFGPSVAPVLIHPSANTTLKDLTWSAAQSGVDGRLPVLHFLLTYSNDLQTNAVLNPVTITFEQVKDNTVIDEVDVHLQVATSTNIEQEMTTHAYALMKGKGTTTDTYRTSVTFPVYVTQVGGELSTWTFTGASWDPGSGFDAETWQSKNGYSGNAQFGMTVEAAYNADDINGWDKSDMEVYDSKATNKVIGETYGRRPTSIDFILRYDGNQKVNENTVMGTLTLNFELTNFKASTPPYTKNVTVKVIVERIGQGTNWYVDGEHGDNGFEGKNPNAAKETVNAVLKNHEYKPGDEIYIVNKVSTGNSAVEWDGYKYGNVTIYRYTGGHTLKASSSSGECYLNYTTEYGDSPSTPVAYKGTLVEVTSDMTMHGIDLNGSYYGDSNPNTPEIVANAPLVEIKSGSLTLDGSTLQHNYNSAGNGGGIIVDNGATLNMTDSYIQNNLVNRDYNGGGVYLMPSATMKVNNVVVVTDNMSGTTENNVYLPTYRSWITVEDSPTLPDPEHPERDYMRIGITKTVYYDDVVDMLFAYTPVVQSQYEIANNEVVHDHLVFNDEVGYSVEKIDGSHLASSSVFYSYLAGTWYTVVTTEPVGFNANNIDTPEELAWVISLVNGREIEDGGTPTAPTAKTDIRLTADIDMGAHTWVPIGTSETPYAGNFDGNGHVVTGLQSPLLRDDMGLFGVIGSQNDDDAKIENMMAQVEFRDGPMKNVGTIAGSMEGKAAIINCEGSGTLKGSTGTEAMGGLVGKATAGVGTSPTAHSSFAVADITASDANTFVGGLAGINSANLYNSYSNVTMSGGKQGGLVGSNSGRVENCYTTTTTNAFAHTNSGSGIKYCYAPTGASYVGTGDDPSGHGTYSATFDRKAQGYMYGDNVVTLESGETNTYYNAGDLYAAPDASNKITYDGNHRIIWNGMLYALSTWAITNPESLDPAPTPWFRPTTQAINNDLPILGFNKDVCVATLDEDGRFLEYDTNLDNLLTIYNAKDKNASVFLYKDQTGVANTPDNEVFVYINENACLLQNASAPEFKNTTVGITFDNSDRGTHGYDYYGNKLFYDWHMMSTPLRNAPMGLAYKTYDDSHNPYSEIDLLNMEDSYFPNFMPKTLGATSNSNWNWDFYSYYEPEYHWINLKRNKNNHYHLDNGENITYNESDQAGNAEGSENCVFIPGKGYMMAVQKDSYMSSTGTLNKGDVSITLTQQSQAPEGYGLGCNLIGNPYQAYLNLELVNSDLENSSNYTFYSYDADLGVYAPYAPSSSTNPRIPSQYIHPHQAFFVVFDDKDGEGNPVTSRSFKLKPSMATINQPDSYFREDRPNYPLVNLFAENAIGQRDLAIIEFNRPELGGACKVDAMLNANFKIAAHMDQQSYGLLFTPVGTERVPVRFKTEESGVFTLRWETYNGIFSTLYLIDNKMGVTYDMLANDTYTFEASVDDYVSRFAIVFECTDVNENVTTTTTPTTFAFFDGSEWVVNGKGQLDIIDVLGHVLRTERLYNDQNRVNLSHCAKGVYLMRLVDGDRVRTQKIVLQ